MSDIDTVVVDSLKVLDPERPIREADIGRAQVHVRFVSGWTIVRACKIDGNHRYNWTKNLRSPSVRRTLPCTLRRSTIN